MFVEGLEEMDWPSLGDNGKSEEPAVEDESHVSEAANENSDAEGDGKNATRKNQ